MTLAGIRPRSLTGIPCARAQARTASDCPGGATLAAEPADVFLRAPRRGRSATGSDGAPLRAVLRIAVPLDPTFSAAADVAAASSTRATLPAAAFDEATFLAPLRAVPRTGRTLP